MTLVMGVLIFSILNKNKFILINKKNLPKKTQFHKINILLTGCLSRNNFRDYIIDKNGGKMKKLITLTFFIMLLCSFLFADNIIPTRTDVAGFSTWTDTSVAGTTYLQLVVAGASTITPAMDFNGYTAETLNFKARTYAGTDITETTIYIAISTDNGSNWTVITTRVPGSSTLTAMDSIDLSSYNGTQVKIKFSVAGTSNTIGAGIDDITITGTPAPTGPTITLTPTTLSGFTYVQGAGPSEVQAFVVSGSSLTNDITIDAPTNYEISKTSGSGYTSPLTFTESSGTVTTQTVYVRLKAGLTAASYNSEAITATSTGATDKTVTCSGTIYKPEASNHVTSFNASTGSPSSSSINFTWTAPSEGIFPDGYLIRGSNVSYAAISNPSDGTPVSDSGLDKNITYGTNNYTFSGLTDNTTYYFKIFPYTNTSTNINYKTDDQVPNVLKTTDISQYLINEGFNAGTSAPSGWIFTNIGGTYPTSGNYGNSSPSIKFDNSNDRVETNTFTNPGKLSFWLKGMGATGSLKIEAYYNSTWNEVNNITSLPTTGTVYEYLLNHSATQVRFTYTKSSSNIALDDVTVTRASTYESGSAFSVPSITPTGNFQVIGRFKIHAFETGATLNSITVKLNGTGLSGITSLDLHKSSNDTFEYDENKKLAYESVDLNTLANIDLQVQGGDIISTGDTYYFLTINTQNATGTIKPDLIALNVTDGNVSDFTNPSPLSDSDAQTLPVELSSFTAIPNAVNQSVTLNWITQSETDLVGYYVYRSNDNSLETANRYSNIITGTNTSTQQNYTWTDSNVEAGDYYYWLMSVDRDGSTDFYGPVAAKVLPSNPEIPTIGIKTAFNSIYPNPFNPSTSLAYSLENAGDVKITIYNIKGEIVKVIYQNNKAAGNHAVVWNGTDSNSKTCGSGVYFFKLESGKYNLTKKALLVK